MAKVYYIIQNKRVTIGKVLEIKIKTQSIKPEVPFGGV